MSTLTPPTAKSHPSAADDDRRALAAAEKRVGELTRTLARTRAEVAAAYLTRDTLGEALRRSLAAPAWRWGWPGFLLARAAGRLTVTGHRLVPMTGYADFHRGENQSWHGTGMPLFLVPITPLVGWVRVRATIHSSVSSRACLYFDTGSGFHQKEHLELGPVAGETVIDRMVPLRTPTYLMRFDAVQAAGEWRVEGFSLEPMGRLWFNASAVAGNAAKLIRGRGRTGRRRGWG